MVESETPLECSFQLAAPFLTNRTSYFFELLEKHLETKNKTYRDLWEHQEEAVREALDINQKKGIFYIAPTGKGKTIGGFAIIFSALTQEKIGVYLVPYTQLLEQKKEQIKTFFKNTAHLITLTGETRPNVAELREHRNHLIILATFEAFRAFLLQVQARKYFDGHDCFGAVVVDEAHMLGDPERGWKLETLLYYLQNHYPAIRLCFLTATFTEADATVWSQLMNCKLVYWNPIREFSCTEVIKLKSKKRFLGGGESARQEKIRKALKYCWQFLKDHISGVDLSIQEMTTDENHVMVDWSFPQETPPQIKDSRMLIFCHSRKFSEQMAYKINKALQIFFKSCIPDEKRIAEVFSCQYIHAGIRRKNQKPIFHQFEKGKGIRILCCSPILEAGIDVSDIHQIIITDGELYTAYQLAQMCGRTREKDGKIVLFVAEETPPYMGGCLSLFRGFLEERGQGKLVFLCGSKELAEVLSDRLRAYWKNYSIENHLSSKFQCELIHQKIPTENLIQTLEWFEMGEGIRILCLTPWAGAEFDLSNPQRVVVVKDNEFGSVLAKLSELISLPWHTGTEVQFLEGEDLMYSMRPFWKCFKDALLAVKWSPLEVKELDFYDRGRFYHEKVILNKPFLEIRGEEDKDLRILKFILNALPPRITSKQMPLIILESLARHQFTLKKLEIFLAPYIAKGIQFDLKMILKDLRKDQFVRGDIKDGRYSLTYLGYAIVETGIALEFGLEFVSKVIKLFQMQQKLDDAINNSPSRKINKQFEANLNILIAKTIATKFSSQTDNSDIEEFMKQYQTDDIQANKKLRNIYKISEGDEEMFRRTAIWIASSLYLLYYGYRIHQKAIQNTDMQYYQLQYTPFPPEEHDVQERFLRLIQRFQLKGEERPRKPKFYPHPKYLERSLYKKAVLKILESKKEKGALKEEILSDLKKINKKKRLIPMLIPDSTLHSVLTKLILEGRIYKVPEPSTANHRPPDRYWHIQYKPRSEIRERCKDCLNFVKDPTKRDTETGLLTNCRKFGGERTELQLACPDFIPRSKARVKFSDFESIKIGKNRYVIKWCPWCRGEKTVIVPTYDHVTICKQCKTLFWQTQKGHYIGQHYVDLEVVKTRIDHDEDGYLYISVFHTPQKIFLDKNRSLKITQKEKSKISIVQLYHSKKLHKSYFLSEIGYVYLAGGDCSEEDLTKLRENNISIIPYTTDQIAKLELKKPLADLLREKLSKLDGIPLLNKAQDLIISKMLSNIVYTLQFKKFLVQDRVQDFVLRQLDRITFSFFALRKREETDIIRYINQLRSQEGIAEKAIWDAIKEALPPEWKIKGRQASRYISTVLYWGAKAFDPFNAGLNYLYFCLQQRATEALTNAGFDPYYPGPGILHHRQVLKPMQKKNQGEGNVEENQWARTKKNREFIFDFIDSYRPPLRHYFLLAILNGTFDINTDFASSLDEWCRRVYYPTQSGQEKLKNLFRQVCATNFIYKSWKYKEFARGKMPLGEIMNLDAEGFAHFLRGENEKYFPFIAYENYNIMKTIEQYYQKIRQIADYKPPTKSSKIVSEDTTEVTEDNLEPDLPTNVVVVVHNDEDGFASALLLLIKYYKYLPNVNIIVAENNPNHILELHRVLEEEVPKSLVNQAHNIVIVADFRITQGVDFYQELMQRYKKISGGMEDRIHLIWYDHHLDPSISLENLHNIAGIDVHHDISQDAYRIIWHNLQDTLDPTQLGSTHPWKLYKKLHLSPEQKLQRWDNPTYLDKWFYWFENRWHNPRRDRGTWTGFFYNICRLRKPKEPIYRPCEGIPLENLLLHVSILENVGGQTFAVLVFRCSFPIAKVGKLILKLQAQQHLPQQLPDFVFCYWHDHTCSLRVYNSTKVSLLGIQLDQGLLAHELTGPIYRPRRHIFHLSSADIYQYLPLDDLLEFLLNSKLTKRIADLLHRELQPLKKYTNLVVLWKKKVEKLKSDLSAQERRRLQDELLAAIKTEYGRELKKDKRRISFPHKRSRKNIDIPKGDVVLFFSSWKTKYALSHFFHYFLHRYLRSSKRASKVLYITTTSDKLRFSNLIEFATPIPMIRNIFFTKIEQFSNFSSFLKADLRSLILQQNIDLIIIDSPFKLIEAHLRSKYGQTDDFYLKRSPLEAEMVETLKKIATNTGASFILTNILTKRSSISPLISRAALENLKYRLYFKKQTQKKFHLTWQIPLNKPKPLKIYRPTKKSPHKLLISDLSEELDSTIQLQAP